MTPSRAYGRALRKPLGLPGLRCHPQQTPVTPIQFSNHQPTSLQSSHQARGCHFKAILRAGVSPVGQSRPSAWLKLRGGPRQEISPGFPPAPGFWHVIKWLGFLCFMSSESTGRCWFNQFGCLLSLATEADGEQSRSGQGSPRESHTGVGPPGWPEPAWKWDITA